ncbi:MAG: phosphoribosylanthranilate isomerase [Bacteroidota bacterium]|jgi:phosphoribosylanthranilate isomerase
MALFTRLKLSGINNLSDARFAAAAGFEYIGFCFNPESAHYLAPVKAKEIIDWTTGCAISGEFGHQPVQEIADISTLLNLDVVELNNSLLPDELQQIDKAIIKHIDTAHFNTESLLAELNAYAAVADGFLVYTSSNLLPDESVLKHVCSNYKIIWGFDVNAADIKHIVQHYQPYAINLQGGDEERPGVKDFDTLNDILDAVQLPD